MNVQYTKIHDENTHVKSEANLEVLQKLHSQILLISYQELQQTGFE